MTSILAIENQRNRQKCWHKKMTQERRCHWCGKPSAVDFANACEEHKEAQREINRKSKEKAKLLRIEQGLCISCGKRLRRFGYETCQRCSDEHALYLRKLREKKAVVRFDEIIDCNLVTVSEASRMIGVHRVEIHRLIRIKVLRLVEKKDNKFWLKEGNVNKYARKREAMRLTLVVCIRCGHEWSPQRKTKQLRCPIKGCRGLNIKRLTLDTYLNRKMGSIIRAPAKSARR